MSVLVVAEALHGKLHLSTKHVISAAQSVGGDIDILVYGNDCLNAAKEAAAFQDIRSVKTAEDQSNLHSLAEPIAALIASQTPLYTHILAASTSTGKDILPRAAALSDAMQISDIIQVIAPDTFVRPIYAGNALETVQTLQPTTFITVRSTAFPPAGNGGEAPISALNINPAPTLSRFVTAEETKTVRPDLTAARVVISGGRGLGSAENFSMLERIADKLGAAIGASRAAVDAGYVPNDYQVGQTGKVVAPELYIAVGISGAIQHLAGMKDSKVIVAINKDENAPIFEIADYGLVADLFTALPELEQALK